MEDKFVTCELKVLPEDLMIQAANTAVELNPQNAPNLAPPIGVEADESPLPPARIAALTSRYWGAKGTKLSVSFLENTPTDLASRIVSHMNAWSKTANVQFALASAGKKGAVRITRNGGGYWSYLGTDILTIPSNQPTMSLEAFSMQTPESEYLRVVRHETGHTLAFPHEHQRKEIVALLDRQKSYDYFRRTSGWSQQTVDQQVFKSLDDASLMETPPDRTSIMCYRFPASITKNGEPIPGGSDIDPSDYVFAAKIYPKPSNDFDMI